MTDIWGFLLQTLTASGAAALLLIVKAMFRDKLSPRWQFAVWGVLGLVLLLPAGLSGRYVLFNWPLVVETLKTFFAGEYTLTHVTVPVPLPKLALPKTAADWIFAVYAAGAVLFLGRYIVSYFRLRRTLRRGKPVDDARMARIREFAKQHDLPTCPMVEVPGLTSAFVCGVFRPILALPAGEGIDGKVLLHELLHLKHRDAAWGLAVCFFRCVHWCNPLLWYCADRAGNDVEAACDQRVLERLEGEDRRDYGHILLSMTNDRYARTPGTSSMANGGRNIRRRIEAIARFKRYPAGMGLVSVCVAVILAAPLLLGTRASGLYFGQKLPLDLRLPAAMSSARTTPCTTPAGALDAYGKAVLTRSAFYRAMCAPLEEQAALAAEMKRNWPSDVWEPGLDSWADYHSGYYIYNLEPAGEDAYEGLLTVELNYPPEGQPFDEAVQFYIGAQTVRAEKQDGRWVVIPQEDFWTAEVPHTSDWGLWGCEELPSYTYEAQAADFRVLTRYQTVFTVDSMVTEETDMSWFTGPSTRYDTVPKPNAEFEGVHWHHSTTCVYEGDEADKEAITHLGISLMPVEAGEERPFLRHPGKGDSGGSSNTGEDWGAKTLGRSWGPAVWMSGGGSTHSPEEAFDLPDSYAADFYINGEKAAELTLRLREGGSA